MKPKHDAKAAANELYEWVFEQDEPLGGFREAFKTTINRHCPDYTAYIKQLQAALRREAHLCRYRAESLRGPADREDRENLKSRAAALETLADGPEGVKDARDKD